MLDIVISLRKSQRLIHSLRATPGPPPRGYHRGRSQRRGITPCTDYSSASILSVLTISVLNESHLLIIRARTNLLYDK